MAKVPDNLLLLHQGEETLRLRALELVEANPDLADHLDITERAMDVIDMLRQHYGSDDDERAISHLGIRTFNGFGRAGTELASSRRPFPFELFVDVLMKRFGFGFIAG